MTLLSGPLTLHNLHKVEIEPGDIGATVRLGAKWMHPTLFDQIDLCECLDDTHVVVGLGQITDRWYGRFDDVPARFLEFEHELSSRQYSGLYASMKRAYGNTFNEFSEVCVLEYSRIS